MSVIFIEGFSTRSLRAASNRQYVIPIPIIHLTKSSGFYTVPYRNRYLIHLATLGLFLKEITGIGISLFKTHIEQDQIVLTPKMLVDRAGAFDRLEAIGKRSRAKRQHAGLSDEALDGLIDEAVQDIK